MRRMNAYESIDMKRPGGKKKRKNSRPRIFWLIAVMFILGMTLVSGYLSYVYALNSSVTDINKADIEVDPGNAIQLEIPMGSSTQQIIDIMVKNGIIKYPNLFRALSMFIGYDGTYLSGIHLLEKGIDYNSLSGYERLMKILASKPLDNPTINVMIPEGKNYKEIIEILSNSKLINKEKFDQIAENESFDYKFMKDIPQRPHRLEGYLFPDTYTFDIKGGEKKIIQKMLDQFNSVIVPEYYERAKQLKFKNMDQVLILASLIEKEARVDEERPVVSGVFHNRLKSKAPLNRLQSCATLQYILFNRTGVIKEFITLDDEKIDDPYNTYMYPGLPPGPICSPGRASIDAALYPEEHGYYYFVAKDDGTGGHYFSKTYNEHLAAIKKAEKNRAAQSE